MKYKISCLVFFLTSLFCIGIANALSLPLLSKVIYLDPGHGGYI